MRERKKEWNGENYFEWKYEAEFLFNHLPHRYRPYCKSHINDWNVWISFFFFFILLHELPWRRVHFSRERTTEQRNIIIRPESKGKTKTAKRKIRKQRNEKYLDSYIHIHIHIQIRMTFYEKRPLMLLAQFQLIPSFSVAFLMNSSLFVIYFVSPHI